MTSSASPPIVDVLVPVYNEAHVLRTSITRLHRYLTDEFPFTWRITVVDNASTDGTLAEARQLAAELPGVEVLHLDLKGRGRALKAGWLATDAQIAAYMDVDLSTGLNALLPMVAALISGHSDVAIGSRLALSAAVARGPQREFISRTYNRLLRMVFLNRFRDAQCGFKAIRTDIARLLVPSVDDDGWFFDTELLLLAEHNGLRVFEVPVDWIDDPDTRVKIGATISQDLRGMARMLHKFITGNGTVDLGPLRRPNLGDDMGRQLVGFLFVGLVSTTLSLLLFLALRDQWGAIAANLVAFTLVAAANTWANRRYTFGHHGRHDRARQYVGAGLVWLLGATLSTVALAMVGRATASLFAELATLFGVWTVMAVVRFALLRSWVFRPRALPTGVQRTRLAGRGK